MDREFLTLTKDWAPYKAGKRLWLLRPGEEIGADCVDMNRGATLVTLGYAVLGDQGKVSTLGSKAMRDPASVTDDEVESLGASAVSRARTKRENGRA